MNRQGELRPGNRGRSKSFVGVVQRGSSRGDSLAAPCGAEDDADNKKKNEPGADRDQERPVATRALGLALRVAPK